MAAAGLPKDFRNGTGSPGWLKSLRGRKVLIETYGCRYNFGDTAKLAEILRRNGCSIVDTSESADAIVINTCTVVGPTERRMLRRLAQFRDRDLYVTGCMAKIQQEAIFAVCSPTLIIPDEIYSAFQNTAPVGGDDVGIIQIACGCPGECSYCIARLARGPLKSFGIESILAQIRSFEAAGIPEIQLTAQDVSAWGLDTGQSLPELLSEISALPGRFRVRVGMMNPATITNRIDELADAFTLNHIFGFVHIPVQSGSDSVLRRMKRGYTVEEFEEIVAAFRKISPTITVATDLIVGFPGETDEDFSQSLDLIGRVRPNKANITRYSSRPFTGAAAEKDFPDWVKKDRSRILHRYAEQIYRLNNESWLGSRVPFIVTEKVRDGSVLCRSPEYQGIVIHENLPIGYEGTAILKKEKKYYFVGERNAQR
jgi:MiaB/RimO family radical SAM methylthiotransferase